MDFDGRGFTTETKVTIRTSRYCLHNFKLFINLLKNNLTSLDKLFVFLLNLFRFWCVPRHRAERAMCKASDMFMFAQWLQISGRGYYFRSQCFLFANFFSLRFIFRASQEFFKFSRLQSYNLISYIVLIRFTTISDGHSVRFQNFNPSANNWDIISISNHFGQLKLLSFTIMETWAISFKPTFVREIRVN